MAVIDARDAHPDERGDRQPDLSRVDLGSIARDDPGVLKFANPFDDGGRGQPDPPAEFGVAGAGVCLQFLEYLSVNIVDHKVDLVGSGRAEEPVFSIFLSRSCPALVPHVGETLKHRIYNTYSRDSAFVPQFSKKQFRTGDNWPIRRNKFSKIFQAKYAASKY